MPSKNNQSLNLTFKICEIAEKLFTRFGVKSVSMDDVCKELGISKKTLYKSVLDKEELIKNTLENHIENTKKIIDNVFAEESNAVIQLIKIAHHILERYYELSPNMVHELKKYYPNLYLNVIEYKEKYILNYIKNNLKNGIEQKLYKPNLNIEITSMFYISLVDSCFDSELVSLNKIPFNTKYKEIISYHLNSICTIEGLNIYNQNEIKI